MAQGTNLDSSSNSKVLKLAHTAAVTASDIILLAGRVLLATLTTLANEDNIFVHTSGRVEMPKESPLVIAAGVTVYWDDAAKVVTTTATANTKCGIAYQAASSADTVVVVVLDNSVNF